jgi:oligopeptide/dipeptide ABC transporter ATP-binding protein
VQIIFQDPFASLNPRRNVYNTLSEPMKIHGLVEPELFEIKVIELLAKVGLGDVLERFPHEFSGGQRQRICIARALAVSPELIVADEPLSALDVSIQAQILNLLQELRRESGISFVFISHDLRVVEYFSDEVGVMYLGKIVEQAPSEELFAEPRHPYTEVLLASAPGLEPGAKRKAVLGGEVPSPIHIPSGCSFHPRCPKKFDPCDKIVPALGSESGRPVACHLWNSY